MGLKRQRCKVSIAARTIARLRHARDPSTVIRASALVALHAVIDLLYPTLEPQLSSNAADLLDVILAGGFVRSFEEASGIFAEPLSQLVELFAKTVDGLLVHVCLGDEFREGD